MHRINRSLSISLILLLSVLSCSDPRDTTLADKVIEAGEGFRVGVALADISPKSSKNMDLEGYDEPRPSEGIHDPITARCLVILDDQDITVLVSLDLIGLLKFHIDLIKQGINYLTGIDKEHIFIHCTHTHSGPATLARPAGLLTYREMLMHNINKAVLEAMYNTTEARCVFRSGYSKTETVNRRHPNQEVLNKYTCIDFLDNNQNPVASILNFACHPVVLGHDNKEMTADFVYYLRQQYENRHGGISLFFNGALGDMNPPPVNSKYVYSRNGGTFSMAEALGTELANEMIDSSQYCDTAGADLDLATKEILLADKFWPEQNTNIGIIDLGMAQIALLGGEPLQEMGQSIDTLFPGPYKMVFGMIDGYLGYLVPETEWENCSYSFLETGCYEETRILFGNPAEKIYNGFQELANSMFYY